MTLQCSFTLMPTSPKDRRGYVVSGFTAVKRIADTYHRFKMQVVFFYIFLCVYTCLTRRLCVTVASLTPPLVLEITLNEVVISEPELMSHECYV